MTNRSRPLVIAHRGASRAEPENTLAAFRRACELGADMVELDVRVLADGRLAVHHDAHLPDGRPLTACTAADLPSHVPLLAAALEACAGMDVNVEIKNDQREPGYDAEARVAEEVDRVVRAAGAEDRVLVSSFDLGTLDRSAGLGLPTAWLVSTVGPAVLDRLVAHGHRVLHPNDRAVDEALMTACHDRGITVNVWTVDDPDRMRALAALGVHGICTNVPDVAVAVLGR